MSRLSCFAIFNIQNSLFFSFQRSPLSGPISFKSACFSYPTRPTVDVLSGLNLEVRPGQKVALVGPSGAGKSTCLQMIQRTHQLTSGELVNMRSMRKSHPLLSSRFAQEYCNCTYSSQIFYFKKLYLPPGSTEIRP